MKLVRHKHAEYREKRKKLNNGHRMLEDHYFVEENLDTTISEMDVFLQERERMRDKITELLRRITELEAKLK